MKDGAILNSGLQRSTILYPRHPYRSELTGQPTKAEEILIAIS